MRLGLQAVLVALGLVAVSFELAGLLGGAATVRDAGSVAPNVDSEFSFFASWYLGAGVVLLVTVRRLEESGTVIRSLCALLLLAAGGRALSIATVGAPHPLYVILMAVEVAIPAVVIPWQTAVTRRIRPSRPAPGPPPRSGRGIRGARR